MIEARAPPWRVRRVQRRKPISSPFDYPAAVTPAEQAIEMARKLEHLTPRKDGRAWSEPCGTRRLRISTLAHRGEPAERLWKPVGAIKQTIMPQSARHDGLTPLSLLGGQSRCRSSAHI
jgi:hypothetical protein